MFYPISKTRGVWWPRGFLTEKAIEPRCTLNAKTFGKSVFHVNFKIFESLSNLYRWKQFLNKITWKFRNLIAINDKAKSSVGRSFGNVLQKCIKYDQIASLNLWFIKVQRSWKTKENTLNFAYDYVFRSSSDKKNSPYIKWLNKVNFEGGGGVNNTRYLYTI